jgi:hypothetical protein
VVDCEWTRQDEVYPDNVGESYRYKRSALRVGVEGAEAEVGVAWVRRGRRETATLVRGTFSAVTLSRARSATMRSKAGSTYGGGGVGH